MQNIWLKILKYVYKTKFKKSLMRMVCIVAKITNHNYNLTTNNALFISFSVIWVIQTMSTIRASTAACRRT